jgi:hypothetical protein
LTRPRQLLDESFVDQFLIFVFIIPTPFGDRAGVEKCVYQQIPF